MRKALLGEENLQLSLFSGLCPSCGEVPTTEHRRRVTIYELHCVHCGGTVKEHQNCCGCGGYREVVALRRHPQG
jgi:hypothetical protein